MPTLRILYDVEGWAFHRRALALRQRAPSGFTVALSALPRLEGLEEALGTTPLDAVFLLPGRKAAATRRALQGRGWPTKLIVSWNIGWPAWRDEFDLAYAAADAIIFNNARYWEGTGRPPRTQVICNGVDLRTFRVLTPPARRVARVLWLGSEFHRVRKGYDAFALPLQQRLEGDGIGCDFRLVDSQGSGLLSAAQMAAWYNSGTVLVCTSDGEGTPNVALEAAACGCTVVSTRVGNMPALIRDGWNGFLVEQELGALHAAVRRACDDYPRLAAAMLEAIRDWDWQRSAAAHFALFREVCAEP